MPVLFSPLHRVDPPATDYFIDSLYQYSQLIGEDASKTIAPPLPAKSDKTVVIVGAGAAGLCAAYELLRIGIRPVVLEASDRMGGRAWSKPWPSAAKPGKMTPYAEMGAMRVPPVHVCFTAYAKAFGLSTVAQGFPDPGSVPTVLYYENTAYEWSDPANPPGPFKQISIDFNAFMQPIVEAVDQAYSRAATTGDKSGVAELWSRFISRWWDTSFFDAVAEGIPQWTAEDLNAFGALGVGSGGFGPLYNVGFLEMIRIIATGWETNQQLWCNPSLSLGMQGLTHGFCTTPVKSGPYAGEALQSLACVSVGAAVSQAVYNPATGKTTITYSQTGKQADIVADAVVIATTTRSMEVMGLTLPPSPSQAVVVEGPRTAIRNLHLISSSKMFVCTETKFWKDPDKKIPYNIQTDELPRGIYTLDYPDTDYGVVLISYTWGDDAVKLSALTTDQRFSLFKAIIGKISPAFAEELVPAAGTEIYNVDWDQQPNYYGAFKLPFPGQDTWCQKAYFDFQKVLNAELDTGVYLAGDSISWSGGWTEGALHTGLNAACSVALRCGAAVDKSNSPLSQDPNLFNYSP